MISTRHLAFLPVVWQRAFTYNSGSSEWTRRPANALSALLAPITLPLLTLPLLAHAQTLTVSPGDNLGAVVQTEAIDDVIMTGGTVDSLNQRDGYDTFKMTGGHIKGVFENGDSARFEGGTIGRVDLNLANNVFIMSQDTAVDTRIEGDLLSERGDDTFTLRGGSIGGRVYTGSGDDRVTVSGLGGKTQLTRLDGGAGNDSLVFQGSQLSTGTDYTYWEVIWLNDNSHLRLDDTLTLGDGTSATGILTIDASSTLSSRQGMVAAFIPGQKITVRNAGLIDLSTGNDAQGRLTLNGDYLGDNGTLKLKSVLAGDEAASDRLVVSLGSISGSTNLQVDNLGGAGAATARNGIQVVEAREGATSGDTAFVQTQTLSAGAYDYRLFKGGVTAGSENNWYLRSTLVAPPPASAGEPTIQVPIAAPAPGLMRFPRQSLAGTFPCIAPKCRSMPQLPGAPRSSLGRPWAPFTNARVTNTCSPAMARCPQAGAKPTVVTCANSGAARSAQAWMATCMDSRWARTYMLMPATVAIASTWACISATADWMPTSRVSPWR